MTSTLSVLVIDSRPVRRSRLIQSLQVHSGCAIVGTANFISEAATIAFDLGANVVLVDGQQSEIASYPDAVQMLESQNIAVVPIWAYPESDHDRMRAEMLDPTGGTYGLAENAHRIELLISTLNSARQALLTPDEPHSGITFSPARAPVSTKNSQSRPDPEASIIAIGASTGGVQAISKILASANTECPPILIVQHMPAAFIAGFAERLDRLSPLTVKLANRDEPLQRGHAYISPDADHHLALSRDSTKISLDGSPPFMGHRPAVEHLFDSLLPSASHVRCAILTGMGSDGAAAMSRLRAQGALTIAQSEDTCTVFGMPRAAIECEGVSKVLDLDQIATSLFM